MQEEKEVKQENGVRRQNKSPWLIHDFLHKMKKQKNNRQKMQYNITLRQVRASNIVVVKQSVLHILSECL